MKKIAYVLVITVTITGLMFVCPSAATSKAAWEQKWESTLAAAKKEGRVSIYTLWGPRVTTPMRQSFKQKYGIDLEFTQVGRGSAMAVKVTAEKRAGLHIPDAFGVGATTLITTMKPPKFLGPVEPLLILPEVTDVNMWTGGRLPFVDKDRYVVGMLLVVNRFICYNTNLIKEGELTSYKDLLKPQYKGKIVMGDPSVTGGPNAMLTHIAYDLWNVEETSEWLRLLIKQQGVLIQRDHRLVGEWVAKGKYAIGVASRTPTVIKFMNAGAPITLLVQKDGHMVDCAGGALGVPTVSGPHPNAATVFVNWLLTKEGQPFVSKGYGYPSMRPDVPTKGLNPLCLPKPGEKLFFATEDSIAKRGPLMKVAGEVIKEASRK